MLIGFASTEGGCAHYRAELPARMLRDRGLDAFAGGDLYLYPGGPIAIASDPADEREAAADGWREPDVLVLAGGWPTKLGPDVIRAARACGQRVVVDCDDWPWLPAGNPHHVLGGGDYKLAAMRAADHVTASTPFLVDALARHRIDATLCRNSIDAARYADARAVNVDRPDASRMIAGYRGMLAGFHDADVRTLAGQLPDDLALMHVGADPREHKSFARLARVAPERVATRAAVVFDEYGPQLRGVDLALVPYALRQFSRAKSNIAAMEWTAAGVPWVGAANDELALLDDLTPRLVDAVGWSRVIDELRDPANRARCWANQLAGLARFLEREPFARTWADVVLDASGVRA